MGTIAGASATTTEVVTDPLSSFADGYAAVGTARRAVLEAREAAEVAEATYLSELRQTLRGQLVEITGTLEGEERMGQDGIEMYSSPRYVTDMRVYVDSIWLTEKPYRSSEQTPLVYATVEEARRKQLRGGGLSFRLLEVKKLRIVDEA